MEIFKTKNNKRLIILLALFLLIVLLMVDIFTYRERKEDTIKEITKLQNIQLSSIKDSIYNKLDFIKTDIEILSESPLLLRFVDDPNEENKKLIEQSFSIFSESKEKYDQIRFLNAEGKEVVRINYNGENSSIISEENLQDKSDRYYFSESIEMSGDQIYFSPIDLNIENGEIEIPYKPMIRVAKVVFMDGEKKGVVILNYMAQEILNTLNGSIADSDFNFGLIDSDGYWVKSIDGSNEWNFMFEETKDIRLKNIQPGLWDKIKNREYYNSHTDLDCCFISSLKINYLNRYINDGDYHLYLVSIMEKDDLDILIMGETNSFINMSLIVALFIIIISTLFYFYVLRQEKYDLQLTKKNSDLSKFRLAVDNASDHIAITDTNGVILYANNAAKKITGYSSEEILGKKAGSRELWGGYMSKEFYQKMWQTIKIDKKEFKGEIKNKRKNGEFYFSDVSISPILDEKGEVLFFVAIERDITEIKEIDKAKSEFVSLASHQLRTPLSAIRWYSEMLRDQKVGELNKKQKEYLNEIEKGNSRMLSLVNSLLNVSRIELGTFVIDPIKLDIVKALKEILLEFKPIAQKAKIKIKTNFEDNLPEIKVDKDLLGVIYQNLISNAIKYSPEKGEVKVSIYKKGKKIFIEVEDNGFGIPKRQQKDVFTKLFRADNIQSKDVSGTGLGLYIVKEILDKADGKISFKSKENVGTKFTVELPLTGMKNQKGTRKLT